MMAGCGSAKSFKVRVTNQSHFDRSQEMVEIPIADIRIDKESFTSKDDLIRLQAAFVVKNAAGEIVPSQETYDAKLIFQSGLHEGATEVFTITIDDLREYEARTYGRYIAERKDDYAWENDRVAFRIYGPALLPVDGPSNGIDAWYKRTSELVIDKWYRDDLAGVASYHNDNGEGQDDYKVGRTLGAGAMAPYADGRLWLNENYVSQQTLDNGPLRTTFKVTYKDLDVNGTIVSESRTFSIDAGSQLTKVTQEYGVSQPMEVAAGIVMRGRPEDEFMGGGQFILYEEADNDKVGSVYMGVVYPEGFKRTAIDTYEVKKPGGKKDKFSHALGLIDYTGQPVTYYTGYGWSKFGFGTKTQFAEYLENFARSKREPLVVEYLGK